MFLFLIVRARVPVAVRAGDFSPSGDFGYLLSGDLAGGEFGPSRREMLFALLEERGAEESLPDEDFVALVVLLWLESPER